MSVHGSVGKEEIGEIYGKPRFSRMGKQQRRVKSSRGASGEKEGKMREEEDNLDNSGSSYDLQIKNIQQEGIIHATTHHSVNQPPFLPNLFKFEYSHDTNLTY